MGPIRQRLACCGSSGSPFFPLPAPVPGKITHHDFQIRAQESLHVRHLHQNFTFQEEDRTRSILLHTFPRVPKEAAQQCAAQADNLQM